MASRVVGLILLAVIAAGLLWIGAEQHYRACIEARLVTGVGGPIRFDDSTDPDPLTHASIKGCRRAPF